MKHSSQFGTKELERALTKLGFASQKSVGSSHRKWKPPTQSILQKGSRSFILVVEGKKTYVPKTCNGYIKQIMIFGFSLKEIGEAFSKKIQD